MRRICFLATALLCYIAAAPVQATTITFNGPWSTGIDLYSVQPTPGPTLPTPDAPNGFDDFWRVENRPAGGGTTIDAAWIGTLTAEWWPNDANSRWIEPYNWTSQSGDYTFYTWFWAESGQAPGTYLTDVLITGIWASDGRTKQVTLNGYSPGPAQFVLETPNPWITELHDRGYAFQLRGRLYEDLNTITFKVHHPQGQDPPRLRVQFQGIQEVPEPATMGLIGLGLIGLATLARRTKKN